MAKTAKRKGKTRKEKKNVPSGIIHIQSTFNNTIVTITDLSGNVVAQSSAGRGGIKGIKKKHPLCRTDCRKRRFKKSYGARYEGC